MKDISWKITIVFSIIFLFFIFYLFPKYEAEINQISKTEIKLLDTHFSYTKDDVLSLFQTLKKEGRAKVKFFSGVVDMIYPIIYGILFFLLLKKLTKNNSRFKMISFTPLLAVLFDYIENFSILNMLNSFPNITNKQVMISSYATSFKWVVLAIYLIFLLTSITINIINKKL